MSSTISQRKIAFAILVAALGYFVDGYDIVIFSAVRVTSLKSLGLIGDDLTTTGGFLMNVQLIGMLLGGLVWGILGDKIGRLKILFGSIALYSLANLANAYVVSVDQYAWCRFIGGIGLAGEIGAGITLVSELMSKETRGYGTMIVAFTGLCGIASAGFVGDYLSWQNAFIAGGVMGIVLLGLRIGVPESGMFSATKEKNGVSLGNLRMLLGTRRLCLRYLKCIFVGAAFYICLTIFVVFAPEIAHALGIIEPIKPGKALLYLGGASAVGNLLFGYASQKFGTRKKILYLGVFGALLINLTLLNGAAPTAHMYYFMVGLLGFFSGYWAILISMAPEQFGTNLRATVATSVPNFVRGLGIIHTSLFIALKPMVGVVPAVEIILVSFTLIALVALWFLRETFGIDLNYIESDVKENA